jgi:hypothetical protein
LAIAAATLILSLVLSSFASLNPTEVFWNRHFIIILDGTRFRHLLCNY